MIAEQIKHLAYHDALSNLPNRLLFKDRLTVALSHASGEGSRLAVLFLDLSVTQLQQIDLVAADGNAAGDHAIEAIGDLLGTGSGARRARRQRFVYPGQRSTLPPAVVREHVCKRSREQLNLRGDPRQRLIDAIPVPDLKSFAIDDLPRLLHTLAYGAHELENRGRRLTLHGAGATAVAARLSLGLRTKVRADTLVDCDISPDVSFICHSGTPPSHVSGRPDAMRASRLKTSARNEDSCMGKATCVRRDPLRRKFNRASMARRGSERRILVGVPRR